MPVPPAGVTVAVPFPPLHKGEVEDAESVSRVGCVMVPDAVPVHPAASVTDTE